MTVAAPMPITTIQRKASASDLSGLCIVARGPAGLRSGG
jgi:hypothetical protein